MRPQPLYEAFSRKLLQLAASLSLETINLPSFGPLTHSLALENLEI
jgi:hypothetical protein